MVKSYRIHVKPRHLAEQIARKTFEVEARRELCRTILGRVVASEYDPQTGWTVQVVRFGR